MNELVRRASIEEICGHRARALELYSQGIEMLREARSAHARACPTLSHISDVPNDFGRHLNWGDSYIARELETIKTNLDRDIWKAMIGHTTLGSLMDRQEREKFEQALNDNPPEVTPDTAYATLSRLAGEADMIFRRGLVNAFSRLCRDYKSNDGFKIGDRIVITWGVSFDIGWFRFCTHAENTLMDVDRVMHVLDGKPTPTNTYTEGLCGALNQQFQKIRSVPDAPKQVETPYWKVKFFKNGNIHLWVLRDDLRRKANKLIAEHFGEVLAAGFDAKHAAPATEPEFTPKEYGVEDLDFFRSPPNIVSWILRTAEIELDMFVLEPSAGDAAIVKELVSRLNRKSVLTAIELDDERADITIREMGLPFNRERPTWSVICRDFLQVPPDPKYDRVVMNPPFSKGQDIRHVWHAFKFLRPGGRLVAVMPASVKAGSTRKERQTFQDWLISVGARIEDLPADSFKVSGTGVNTVLVTIDKARAE
jgi:Domain of unknown function (DUF4942)/Methyltransferase small domain